MIINRQNRAQKKLKYRVTKKNKKHKNLKTNKQTQS